MEASNVIFAKVTPEPVTNFNRVAFHENFVVLPDLEMIQQIRVVTTDEAGVPIRERIQADENLTDAQREAALRRYDDQLIQKSTANAFVDAKTGKVVPADAEGAISQKAWFQSVKLGDLKAMGVKIDNNTSVASLIYTLLGNEIVNINARGDL